MPDSEVKRDSARPSGDTALDSKSRRRAQTAASTDHADTERKLARAARSAQRLAQLSEAQRSGETLDLFAEDTERANWQAQNTDIRQGTFEGFELPNAFLAAVQARNTPPVPAKRTMTNDPALPEPVQTSFADVPPPSEAPSETDTFSPPATLAASLIAHDRDGDGDDDRAPLLISRRAPPPELDIARANAFCDTIDALRAVLIEQRTSAALRTRHMRTMLTVIICAMLLVIATGVAQTTVLMRMRHESAMQQDRVTRLMLDQQATLASLFDTDSANLRMFDIQGTHRESHDEASPIYPVSAVQSDASTLNQAYRQKKAASH